MALERRNPLPLGIYWQDLISADHRARFHAWLQAHPAEVLVRKTVERPSGGGTWVLFEVKSPLRWDGPGLPTIATADMTEDQSSQRPAPVPDPLSPGGALDIDLPKFGRWLMPAGLGLAALWVLTRRR